MKRLNDMYYAELTPKLLHSAILFIEKNEHLCTALSERLLEYKRKSKIASTDVYNREGSKTECFFLLYDNNYIVGLVCLIANGRILHHFEFSKPSTMQNAISCTEKLLKMFYGVNSAHSLFCIAGLSSTSSFLANCAMHARVAQHYQEQEYDLMIYTPMMSSDKNRVKKPSGIKLHKCNIQDVFVLSDLQKAYYLEEVVPAGIAFNEVTGRKLLKRDLQKQMIYALYDEEKSTANSLFPVAKAETNAIGFKWCQLGGVYTMKTYRNRGFATFLTYYMARALQKKGYNIALFVKKTNVAAIRAYQKAQFSKKNEFKIIYFS